jgi:hypothetical protein
VIAVSPIGLASSLGGGVQAAAAYRAGLAWPSLGPPLGTIDPDEGEPEPITVHAVPSVSALSGAERLAALLGEALQDLGAQSALDIGSGMGIFLALPDPETRVFPSIASASTSKNGVTPADERRAHLARQILGPAGAAANVDLRALPMRAFGGDQAAFAAATAFAIQAVETRAVRAALVLAVDSLTGPATLELLLDQRRLKNDDNPVGFMAGEAAAAMVLTRQSNASNATPPAALLGAVDVAREPRPLGAERPSDGRVAADCLRKASGPAGGPVPFLVVDNDGENHRAQELGLAIWHLTKSHSPLASSPLWVPAKSFGNTGAAYGGLATCLAARAFARGYAPSSSAVILAAADDGTRAAYQLTAPQTVAR